MTTLVLIMTLLLAQTASQQALAAAESAYERGDYPACLAQLDAVEKDERPSPRTQSIRALALNQLQRPLEAYRSVRLYLRLTEGHRLESNSAHADLVALGATLRARLEAELASKREALTTRGDAQTLADERAAEQRFASTARERQQAFDAEVSALRRKKILDDAAGARRERDAERAACASDGSCP